MHTYKLANSIFDGPLTKPLSVLCISIEILSRIKWMGKTAPSNFKFGTLNGRFLRDGAASMAAKGLRMSSVSSLA